MSSLSSALSRIHESDITKLLCVPGLLEGLISNVLPPLARVFFFRTLFGGSGPFIERIFHQWAEPSAHVLVREALDALVHLRIWRREVNKTVNYFFRPEVQRAFIQRLTTSDAPPPVCVNVSPHDLWQYARGRWADFERWTVSSNARSGVGPGPLGDALLKILRQNVKQNPPWQWLMKRRQAQLWELFVLYFEQFEYLPAAMMTIASLMPLKLGEAVPLDRLKCNSMPFLELLGIVMRDDGNLAVTPLCLAMFRSDMDIAVTRSDLSETPSSCFHEDARDSFHEVCGICVESNFRVFAYTNDMIAQRIIDRFCAIEKEIGGGLVVGTITVDSVLRALQAGIAAKDIVSFLETHKHKECRAIPTNVKLQLGLWEQDRFRLNMEKATMFQWTASDYTRQDGQRIFQSCYAAAGDGVLWARLWNQAEPVQRLYPAFVVKEERAAIVLRELRSHGL